MSNVLPSFRLRLEDTYWAKGFFNVNVDFERFLTATDGPISLHLPSGSISGRISRSANNNATPRIYGNKALATYFQANYKPGQFVTIEIVSMTAVRIA